MASTASPTSAIQTGAPASAAAPASSSRSRLASLDQFRGYTVAGMFLVNFLGSFAVVPILLKHRHTWCSYADTIMPQFLFAVGFSLRLTFTRRARSAGLPAAYLRVARRLGALTLLAVLFYTLEPLFGEILEGKLDTLRKLLADPLAGLARMAKRTWFQTLLHIAVTSLWILPVIRSGAFVRVAWLLASAGMHVVLSWWFNFAWVNSDPVGIDGGPLGFLTWTIPALVGTLACDELVGEEADRRPGKLLAWSGLLILVGYGLSCGTRLYDVSPSEQNPALGQFADSPVLPDFQRLRGRDLTSLLAEPPFFPSPGPQQRQQNYWMMSQRSGSLSYLTFAAGFSLALYVLFYLACDVWGWRLGLFRTLGSNALVAYVLGGFLETVVKEQIPKDAPAWQVGAGFAVFFATTWLLIGLLERRGILLRL
jgi:predicted acyltransferase